MVESPEKMHPLRHLGIRFQIYIKKFKQVLERSDGVLGFSKTKFYFEQKKINQKLANGHVEQLFGKSAA